MNRNQKLTIVFILLGNSFIAGGIALERYIKYTTLIGWIMGIICQAAAVIFAIKWGRDRRSH